jgi:hypothetical protein
MSYVIAAPEILTQRGRIAAAATMLVAAPAVIAGALSAAAPAHADDYYVGIAASTNGNNIVGVESGPTDTNAYDTLQLAQADCQNNGGGNCTKYGTAENQCMALAVPNSPYGWGGGGGWETRTAPNPEVARAEALAAVPGGQLLADGCAYGAGNPTPLPACQQPFCNPGVLIIPTTVPGGPGGGTPSGGGGGVGPGNPPHEAD